MRGYAQYCPIAKASEILGDRWTLLIVREMLGGANGFNELQRGLPGISRSVLAERLRMLERAEIIERRTGPRGRTLDYRLTVAGRDLEAVVQAIGEWGVTWSFTEPRPEELDPDLLIVWMARHVDREQLPPNRTVVQFDFRDPSGVTGWCSSPPRSRSASSIPGSTSTSRSPSTLPRSTASTWDVPSWAARSEPRKLTMSGPRALQRGFGRWFTWSAFAPASRAAPTSAARPRHDSRAPGGCGSNSRYQRILAPEHERGSPVCEARMRGRAWFSFDARTRRHGWASRLQARG